MNAGANSQTQGASDAVKHSKRVPQKKVEVMPHTDLETLKNLHRIAQNVAKQPLDPDAWHGEYGDRHAALTLDLFGPDSTPRHRFLLNASLLDRIEVATANKGAALSQDELLEIAIDDDEGAVTSGFSSDAINAINATYYASSVAFSKESQIADVYAMNITLNYTLGRLLLDVTGPRKSFRVKELACGWFPEHWQYIAEGMRQGGAKRVLLTLTDFVQPTRPRVLQRSRNIKLRTALYNVFDDMPSLPDKERLDAILATYTFDSVWLPEDARLTRIDGQWYQSAYRLKVADWNPRREELLDALRARTPLRRGTPEDYMGIFVEELRQTVDIQAHPYGDIIARSSADIVNVPGGLIRRVVNAFEAQLGSDGVFVCGDVMMFGLKTLQGEECYMNVSELTGVVARYKVEDYAIARDVLQEQHGLRVEFVAFPELARRYLPEDWQAQVPAVERRDMRGLHGNTIMVVRREGAA